MDREFLNKKFEVINLKTKKKMKRVFVLDPEKDHAAREALAVYAEETKNESIRNYICKWLKHLRKVEG